MTTTGWQCPVCGAGVAPTVERCPCVEVTAMPSIPVSLRELARPEDGWIEWKGGTCPVDSRSRVRIKLRDGDEYDDTAEHLTWTHLARSYDIVAYKVLP